MLCRRVKRAVSAKQKANKMTSGLSFCTKDKPSHTTTLGEREFRDCQVETFSSAIANLRADNLFTDFTLVVQERDYPVHRVILAAGSSYFRALFSSGMQECSSNKAEIKEVDQRAMDTILRFLYLGVITKIEDITLLKSVISASNMLQVKQLYEYCCDEYLKELRVNNFYDIWKTAMLYDNEFMIERVLKFLSDHIQEVIKTPEFLLLSGPQLETFLRKSRSAKSELLVNGILMWFDKNGCQQEDETFLLTLFEIVDVNTLSNDCIGTILNSKKTIQSSVELLNKMLQVSSDRLSALSNVNVKNVQMYFVSKVDNDSSYIQTYSYNKSTWSSLVRAPFVCREGAVAVHLNNFIYLIGGKDAETNWSVEVSRYDMKITSSLEKVASMATPRSNAVAVAAFGKIFVYGGTEKTGHFMYSNRCLEIYDPHLDCWSIGKESAYLYKDPSMVEVNGLLYVAEHNHPFMEVYNASDDQWTTQAGINFPSVVFCVGKLWLASCNEKLVFFIKRGNELIYRFFDPVTSKWSVDHILALEAPNILQSVWSVSNRNENLPFVLFLDEEKKLYKFDPDAKICLQLSTRGALVGNVNCICVLVL